MQLFNVWVEPLVEVTVRLSDRKDAVFIEVQWTCLYRTPLVYADSSQSQEAKRLRAEGTS